MSAGHVAVEGTSNQVEVGDTIGFLGGWHRVVEIGTIRDLTQQSPSAVCRRAVFPDGQGIALHRGVPLEVAR